MNFKAQKMAGSQVIVLGASTNEHRDFQSDACRGLSVQWSNHQNLLHHSSLSSVLA